ncbi:MAG: DoxX family membrane protein [Actinomycetota bacterium]|nr:DoxX family membrane protein [Actinomycetota bacterium]
MVWVSTAARWLLGGVWMVAGATKVTDLDGSVRAVRAYRLLPEPLAQVVGAGLPVAEIALGLLLIAGLGVRAGAMASAVLLIVFMAGIGAAWARGLRIDCGCFGAGGDLAAGERPRYGAELARDAGLLLAAGWLAWRPGSRLAVDGALVERHSGGEHG